MQARWFPTVNRNRLTEAADRGRAMTEGAMNCADTRNFRQL
jgi:hypothetical protein